jgi:MFS family permease
MILGRFDAIPGVLVARRATVARRLARLCLKLRMSNLDFNSNPTPDSTPATFKRDLALLALCQGFLLTNNVAFIAINGLVGLALAPSAWLATLPVTGYVLGGALSTGIVARSMRLLGRKRAFQLGLLVGVCATALCAFAAANSLFWLLVAGTFVNGFYNANGSLYRFAAVDVVPAAWKERAISLVLAGGLIGAVAGPNIAQLARNWLAVEFAGVYVVLIGAGLLSLATVSLIRFAPPAPVTAAGTGRPLAEIMRQPKFIVAALSGAVGYGVMNLLMTATPIAMAQCKHPFSDAALVLEMHVIGMFAPSFFTGSLIKRFGALPVMGVGALLNFVCIGVALSGVDFMQFLVALMTLGVGWNFLFTGGSTLLTETYAPAEKNKVQGAMDFFVFGTMALSSFSSGVLVTGSGWSILNLLSLPLILMVSGAIVWLARGQRRALA